MEKFNRNYILRVQKNDSEEYVEVGFPLTIFFDVKRNFYSSSNIAQIRVNNLSDVTRQSITKSQTDYGLFKRCELYAGYGDQLNLCFAGNVSQCLSYREGTNVITEIQAFDGGWTKANTYIDYSYSKGENDTAIIKNIISKTNLKQGSISDLGTTRKKNGSYSGNALDIIQDISGNNSFVDLESVNVLNNESYLNQNLTLLIDSNSGLLTTPKIEGNFITFDILFESNLRIGQIITLKNDTNSYLNGTYRVQLVNHRGTISGAVGGEMRTQIGVIKGFFNNGIDLGK